MMRDSWNLRGTQHILVRRLLQKKKKLAMNIKEEEPKGDEYILGLYLRQRVENLYANSNEKPMSVI